jgi:hypothetical protein
LENLTTEDTEGTEENKALGHRPPQVNADGNTGNINIYVLLF